MRRLLQSLFPARQTRTSRRRQLSSKSGNASRLTRHSAPEVLENRALLAAQFIGSDAPTKPLTAGQTIDIPVIYRTLDDQGDPASLQSNLLGFNLHYDADALTFVETPTSGIFLEGIQVVPNQTRLESDPTVTGDDNDAATETVLVASYSDSDFALFLGWPNAPSVNGQVLYTARFMANAGFTSTTINFSANATGNVIGQASQFEFQSSSLVLGSTSSEPTLSIADAPAVTEGANSVFTVTLSEAATSAVTVQYSTVDGNGPTGAIGNDDFTVQTNQTLTFNPGETSKTISIATDNDPLVEPTETFGVNLFNPSGATIDTASATGTILDDDVALPTLSISDAPTVTEGADSVFTVTLSAAATSNVTVNYSTADGNGPTGATGGVDYVSQTNQQLTFAPGETQKTIRVATEDDPIAEETEELQVILASPSGATIADGTGVGALNDNDVVGLTLSIADAPAVTEGDNAEFIVTLSAASTTTVTVNYSTVDGNGPTGAVGGNDFTAATNGVVQFDPGQTQRTIVVATADDPQTEQTETFEVSLSGAAGASISTGLATGTINDNDTTPPTISIADAPAVTEGADAVFSVTLSVASNSPVSFNYSTEVRTGPDAASASDFTGQSNQTVTFAPGETEKMVAISTIDDQIVESTEIFDVNISGFVGATAGDSSAVGTITDNDIALPTVSISDSPTVVEGADSVFTVSLSAASSSTVTVEYSTEDGNGPTGATGGADYTAATNQTLTFNPGQTSQNVTVSTIDDSVAENTEEFLVRLSNPSGAQISNGQGTGTINDNDLVVPSISISDAPTVTEGADALFTVTLSEASTNTITVNYSTEDGISTAAPSQIAVAGQDYTAATNQLLTFNPGQTSQTITVATIDDAVVEDSEFFSVALFGVVGGAQLGDGLAQAQIDDNDTAGTDAIIKGRKFNDLNENGLRDDGEPWLNGWTIVLRDQAGTVVEQQLTRDIDLNGDNQIDAATESGWYQFTVSPGTYRLSEVQRDGWRQTAPLAPLAVRAHQLDNDLGFRATANNFEDWGGLNERWFIGDGNQWYYITPNGDLFEWDGSARGNLTGNFIDSFSPNYHADTSLLTDSNPADSPTITVAAGEIAPDIDFGNFNFAIDGSIHGRKWHDINGDGQRTADEPWLNGWEIELVSPSGQVVATTTTMDMDLDNDGHIDPSTESGWYWFDGVASGNWYVRETQQDGWEQTSNVDNSLLEAYELDQRLNLRFTRSLFPNWGGLNERWILGESGWHYITPDGGFYSWNGSPRTALSGDFVTRLTPNHHANPALVYDARSPFEALVQVGPGETVEGVNFGNRRTDGSGPTDPTGFAGAGNVSVVVSGPHLVLSGDNHGNGVHVGLNDQGYVTVSGLGNTTIAGVDQPYVINTWTEIPGTLLVNLHGGNDAIVVSGLNMHSAAINTHQGNDFILGSDLNVAYRWDLRSNWGDNSFALVDSTVGGFIRPITGNGNDHFYANGIQNQGTMPMSSGGGNDLFVFKESTLRSTIALNVGPGNDRVVVGENNSFAHAVVDGWNGHDAIDVHSSNTFSVPPGLHRFDQDSISDVDGVLDQIMSRLADAGLDGLLD